MWLYRPSNLEDVESAYQKGGCNLLAAMPIIRGGDVLGVVSLGLPSDVPFTAEYDPFVYFASECVLIGLPCSI
jgi:hypothetical protein